MDIPVSKLVRLDGRERRYGSEAEEPSASAAAVAPTPEPSRSPLTEPLQAPAILPAQPAGNAQPTGNAQPRAAGFTSVIRHLSLYGWLRWIHSSRSDATLRVRTENGSGTIWCSA